MNSSQPLLELKNCSLILDGHTILDEVSFELRARERVALIGANGSGKTMLLKMMRGDVWPTPTGREQRVYRFDGTAHEPAGNKRHIAYVGSERQDRYVRYDWNHTVMQIVTTGLFDEDIPRTKPTATQRAKVERMLRRFGLWSLRARKFLSLSYGQRRLTLVARVFVSGARVLLLDEVFNGLDAKAKDKLRNALQALRERHAWIITSHRPQELPANVTRAVRLDRGKLAPLVLQSGARDQQRHDKRVQHAERASAPRAAARRDAWLIRICDADVYRDYRAVIRQLNWTIHEGEHWAVLGANGSGKSTLLSCIYGDLHPALGGTVERQGVPYGTHIGAWKRRVGWVSPELQADHYLATSIEEIVMSGRYSSVGLNDAPTASDRRLATRWLRFFGIEHLRERGPRQVSYGQLRLTLLARAMVNEPELLLLDEPCTGLDGDVREWVLEMLQRIAQRGTQLVMAVHDTDDIVPAIRHVLRIETGGGATQHCRY